MIGRWQLSDDQPLFRHAPDQLGMPSGIGDVHPAGQHRHGRPADGEGAAMGRPVHPERGARHHHPAQLRQPRPETRRHMCPVRSTGPGADHRDRAQRPEPQIGPAPNPEAGRPGVAQVVELAAPLTFCVKSSRVAPPGHRSRTSARAIKSPAWGRVSAEPWVVPHQVGQRIDRRVGRRSPGRYASQPETWCRVAAQPARPVLSRSSSLGYTASTLHSSTSATASVVSPAFSTYRRVPSK